MSELTINTDTDVEPCGNVGDLSSIYSLPKYDPETVYFIEVETITDGVDGGKMKLPVRSIGYRERGFYFATDLRFLKSHGFEPVFPVDRTLDLAVDSAHGITVAALTIQGEPLIASRGRSAVGDAIEELARWAGKQIELYPGRWTFPEPIHKAIETLDGFETRSDEDIKADNPAFFGALK
jgi:hypothetical protein